MPNGLVERRELYEVGLLALVYLARTNGFRNLKIIPRSVTTEMIDRAKTDIARMVDVVGVEMGSQ